MWGTGTAHPVPSTDLGAGLGEAEDVVDEEQHVLTLLVPEVLGHCQPCQGHPGTGTWGLVHLPIDQGDLRVGHWGQHGVTATPGTTLKEPEPPQGTQHSLLKVSAHLGSGIFEVDDPRLNHLVVQVVALAGPLAHPGEHRVTTVGLGHVVDQLHDQHSLADTSTSKQTWEEGGKKGCAQP